MVEISRYFATEARKTLACKSLLLWIFALLPWFWFNLPNLEIHKLVVISRSPTRNQDSRRKKLHLRASNSVDTTVPSIQAQPHIRTEQLFEVLVDDILRQAHNLIKGPVTGAGCQVQATVVVVGCPEIGIGVGHLAFVKCFLIDLKIKFSDSANFVD